MHKNRGSLQLILDAGGGPGRYTVELAKLGHEIVLLDLTPELLGIARKQIRKAKVQDKVKEIIRGSIDDLSIFEDNSFDAVICLGGALSHVLNKRRREKAVDELIRVAKKNASVIVSVIGRLAVLRTEFIRSPEEIEVKEVFQKVRDRGDYSGRYGFAPCHFYLLKELRESFEKRGVGVLEMAGLEGLASGHPKETRRLFEKYPKAWKVWWTTHLKTCTNPSVVDTSEHFLLACRKQ